jgi:hypothetical protein
MLSAEINGRVSGVVKREFDRVNAWEIAQWEERGRTDENGKACPKPKVRKVYTNLIG